MISREYPELRARYAKDLRAARKRATMARLYKRILRGQPVFMSASDMLWTSFMSKSFMKSEVEWLKNYERGENNAEAEE